MARARSLTGELVLKYLSRFPDSPDKTLARKIYKENQAMFKSLETCHQSVRMYRGHQGKKQREKMKETTHFKPLNHFDRNAFDLPESFARVNEPFLIQQSKNLILSDLHIPYHINEVLEVAFRYGKERDVDTVLCNGDTWDFAPISRHERDWRDRDINTEFESTRHFFRSLRKAFPRARIIVKWGNHCERWEKWLFVKAPELFNVTDFQLEVLMKFGELGIEAVKDKRFIKIGKLTVLHGHELPGMGGVNPARATFLKVLDSVLVSHYHRTSSHVESTLNGDVISVNSTGCLCGLSPLWMPINKWNHGFAYVDHDLPTGEYKLDNLKIINGKVY